MRAVTQIRSSRLPVRWLLCLLVVALGGCASGLLSPSQDTETRSYLLEWNGAQTGSVVRPAGPSLLIGSMRAAAGYEIADMAYVRTPHQLEYFARHRWVDAPARMLEPLLLQAAASSGLFRSVSEAGSATQAQLRLDSRLLHLRQVCRLEPSELQLELRLTLVDMASAQQVGSRVISVSEPINERTPAAGVAAANRALPRLMSQVEAFLAEHVGRK
jgi:cholesterol transport system auxiliary component